MTLIVNCHWLATFRGTPTTFGMALIWHGAIGPRLALQRRLRRRQLGYGNAKSRAAHVVQADPVAKSDRPGVSSMLAADADLEILAHLAALFDADAHQFAHAAFVDADEGIFRIDSLGDVSGKKLARVVARQPEAGLSQIVGSDGEKVRFA